MINAQTEAQKTTIASQAMAVKRAQEGYSYQQERGFDVAEKAAQNESVGQYTNMGIGFGTMAGIGSAVGSTVGNVVGDALSSAIQSTKKDTIQCANCGAVLPSNAKFCMECGAAMPRKCANCGADVPVGGKFCLECGTKL